jgi:hypothetical protein
MSTQPNDPAGGTRPAGGAGPAGAAGPAGGAGAPSEEELRAAYEAELSRISATDMIAQSAVSMLNLGARRLQPAASAGAPDAAGAGAFGAPGGGGAGAAQGERDLEQARDAIDAARALLDVLERRIPQELKPLRDALAQLQMAYAREMQAAPPRQDRPAGPEAAPPASAASPQGPTQGSGAPADAARKSGDAGAGEQQPGPGPAEASGRLWVPGR